MILLSSQGKAHLLTKTLIPETYAGEV